MRPLRYSINVTLDGCSDHQAIPADEESLSKQVDLRLVSRLELASGAVAMRYEPRR